MKKIVLIITLTLASCTSLQQQPQLMDDNPPPLWSWSLPTELRIFPHKNGKYVADYSELHGVAYEGDVDQLKKILKEGISPNIVAWAGNSPLHFAAVAGKTNNCNELLKSGAKVNLQNQVKMTALDYALFCKNKNVIELLLRHGAKKGN